ncbi:hypothetical protein M406DRAFT_72938 [Cryphonectria parasitica EP155]|uniref:Uncharacterized protein n=1 Tax=Cryphonectria parasitica (strain ATCC 38755 / EP155) TaxID=660469 RepID=A0A9P5CK69_CRYP1|nr:uncharacterized protein M406DRAFT_72938 [Cryphonectria parasitica EP155]KAF3760445.1 hypothetical protein M406DRAFT_72938 [Cryphonectria parasitica EP155]
MEKGVSNEKRRDHVQNRSHNLLAVASLGILCLVLLVVLLVVLLPVMATLDCEGPPSVAPGQADPADDQHLMREWAVLCVVRPCMTNQNPLPGAVSKAFSLPPRKGTKSVLLSLVCNSSPLPRLPPRSSPNTSLSVLHCTMFTAGSVLAHVQPTPPPFRRDFTWFPGLECCQAHQGKVKRQAKLATSVPHPM